MRKLTVSIIMCVAVASNAWAQGPPPFLLSWGAQGSDEGEFNEPWSIVETPAGDILVLDSRNNRIQKFTSDGLFLADWGSLGSGPGEFRFPSGITVDGGGIVYVADTHNYRIQIFSSDGVFLGEWGHEGDGPGELRLPWGIATDDNGFVYVTENGGHRVQKFTAGGVSLATWGTGGTGDGDFVSPRGIAVGPSGTIYVAERSSAGHNGRVQKFTPEGLFLAKWSVSWPGGIAVDEQERCYVTRTELGALGAYDSSGNSLWEIGGFSSPEGVAVGADDFIYVCDTYNHRIMKYGDAATSTERVTWGRLKSIYR